MIYNLKTRFRLRIFLIGLILPIGGGLFASYASASTSIGTSDKTVISNTNLSHTLNLAFTADTQPPDPDVFYAGQGLAITTSVYQGLVQYAPNTTRHLIIPDLATAWKVSPNGLTYTFNLRRGVHFHDGTLMTSVAVAASFKRRLDVNQAPAYQLADLASVNDSNPNVAVVHLKKPNSAFLDYLASAYGPKILSPTALKKYAGNNYDQTWLRTHDAGTGPYYIASVTPGQQYILKSFGNYWGVKPYYTTVNISIIPDTTTQQLELEQGQLTMGINELLPSTAINSFETNSSFKVYNVPTLDVSMIWVNPNYGVFASQALMTALTEAMNRDKIVSTVFPGRAKVATQIYPPGIEPVGTATFAPKYDPSVLTKLVKKLTNKTVTLAYQADDPNSEQMANLLQAQLASTGLNVQIQAVPQATIYSWPGNHSSSLPNLLIETNWPDAYNPDTWARIVMSASGGLNYLNCSVPKGDALLNAGREATSQTKVNQDYQKAGDAYAASGCWIPLGYIKGSIIAPNWMRGITYVDAIPRTVTLANLYPEGAKKS